MMPSIGGLKSSPDKIALGKPQVNVSVKGKLNPRKYQADIECIDEEETPGNALKGKASRDRTNTL